MKIRDVKQLMLETGCLKCPKKVLHHLPIFPIGPQCKGSSSGEGKGMQQGEGVSTLLDAQTEIWLAKGGGERGNYKIRISQEKKSSFSYSKSVTPIHKAMVS